MAEEMATLKSEEAARRGRPSKKRGPGRPKGSGKKRGPGRPKGAAKRGPGRPKGSGKKRGPGRPKGSVSKGVSAREARRIAKDAVKAFRAKLPGILRREIKRLL